MADRLPDPQPGEFWATSKGRTVEILARDAVYEPETVWSIAHETDTIAYKFLGGSMIHLRAVGSLNGWVKTEFQ